MEESSQLSWPFTRQDALRRHHDIAITLTARYRELANNRFLERKSKVDTFNSTQGGVRETEHLANLTALDLTRVVWETEGEIKALEEERDDIRWQLANGGCT